MVLAVPSQDAKKAEWCKNYGKTKCPIFWSATVGLGGQTPVLGLENIADPADANGRQVLRGAWLDAALMTCRLDPLPNARSPGPVGLATASLVRDVLGARAFTASA